MEFIIQSSGDWLYTFVEWVTLVTVLLILYLMMVPLKYTHNIHHVVSVSSLHSRTRSVRI